MYKILGTDQKEYGPVSAEQIIQWINQGRAAANTQAQSEGSAEWKPLSSFPEFAAVFAAKASKVPPPPIGHANADVLEAQFLGRDYNIDAGHCVSRSWELVKRNFWLMVGASFVVGLIQGAIPLLAGVCYGGLYFLFLKLVRGERGEFGDAFAGFSQAFLQLFLVGLVASLLTLVGFAVCILPGIYLAVAWNFSIPLVMDKRMDFWPAMELSRKIVSKHWWQLFWLLILNALVCLLGFLCCCVGIYVAIPVALGSAAYAYEDIFGASSTSRA